MAIKQRHFQGTCRECERLVQVRLPPDADGIFSGKYARVRCGNCQTTNSVEARDNQ